MSSFARVLAAQQERRRRQLLLGSLLVKQVDQEQQKEQGEGENAAEAVGVGGQPQQQAAARIGDADPNIPTSLPVLLGPCRSQRQAEAVLRRLHPTATFLAAAQHSRGRGLTSLSGRPGSPSVPPPERDGQWRKPLPWAHLAQWEAEAAAEALLEEEDQRIARWLADIQFWSEADLVGRAPVAPCGVPGCRRCELSLEMGEVQADGPEGMELAARRVAWAIRTVEATTLYGVGRGGGGGSGDTSNISSSSSSSGSRDSGSLQKVADSIPDQAAGCEAGLHPPWMPMPGSRRDQARAWQEVQRATDTAYARCGSLAVAVMGSDNQVPAFCYGPPDAIHHIGIGKAVKKEAAAEASQQSQLLDTFIGECGSWWLSAWCGEAGGRRELLRRLQGSADGDRPGAGWSDDGGGEDEGNDDGGSGEATATRGGRHAVAQGHAEELVKELSPPVRERWGLLLQAAERGGDEAVALVAGQALCGLVLMSFLAQRLQSEELVHFTRAVEPLLCAAAATCYMVMRIARPTAHASIIAVYKMLMVGPLPPPPPQLHPPERLLPPAALPQPPAPPVQPQHAHPHAPHAPHVPHLPHPPQPTPHQPARSGVAPAASAFPSFPAPLSFGHIMETARRLLWAEGAAQAWAELVLHARRSAAAVSASSQDDGGEAQRQVFLRRQDDLLAVVVGVELEDWLAEAQRVAKLRKLQQEEEQQQQQQQRQQQQLALAPVGGEDTGGLGDGIFAGCSGGGGGGDSLNCDVGGGNGRNSEGIWPLELTAEQRARAWATVMVVRGLAGLPIGPAPQVGPGATGPGMATPVPDPLPGTAEAGADAFGVLNDPLRMVLVMEEVEDAALALLLLRCRLSADPALATTHFGFQPIVSGAPLAASAAAAAPATETAAAETGTAAAGTGSAGPMVGARVGIRVAAVGAALEAEAAGQASQSPDQQHSGPTANATSATAAAGAGVGKAISATAATTTTRSAGTATALHAFRIRGLSTSHEAYPWKKMEKNVEVVTAKTKVVDMAGRVRKLLLQQRMGAMWMQSQGLEGAQRLMAVLCRVRQDMLVAGRDMCVWPVGVRDYGDCPSPVSETALPDDDDGDDIVGGDVAGGTAATAGDTAPKKQPSTLRTLHRFLRRFATELLAHSWPLTPAVGGGGAEEGRGGATGDVLGLSAGQALRLQQPWVRVAGTSSDPLFNEYAEALEDTAHSMVVQLLLPPPPEQDEGSVGTGTGAMVKEGAGAEAAKVGPGAGACGRVTPVAREKLLMEVMVLECAVGRPWELVSPPAKQHPAVPVAAAAVKKQQQLKALMFQPGVATK